MNNVTSDWFSVSCLLPNRLRERGWGVGGYIGESSSPAYGMISVLRQACMKRPEAIRVYVEGMVTAHCP